MIDCIVWRMSVKTSIDLDTFVAFYAIHARRLCAILARRMCRIYAYAAVRGWLKMLKYCFEYFHAVFVDCFTFHCILFASFQVSE
jgi:hypothetical protein